MGNKGVSDILICNSITENKRLTKVTEKLLVCIATARLKSQQNHILTERL
jgi:hypothetical protein